MNRLGIALWAGVGLAAAFDLFAASLVLHPNVDPVYRAYFINKSSDCWPQQTDGTYVLGSLLPFDLGSGPQPGVNKVCGWFYPSTQGTWSYGRYSLLRFVFPPAGPVRLVLTAGAMVNPAHPTQRIAVSANGTPLTTLVLDSLTPSSHAIDIPPAIAATGAIDLRFDYPDARPGNELGSNEDAHLRALRMVSLALQPVARK